MWELSSERSTLKPEAAPEPFSSKSCPSLDRKSTRLNSSHQITSYAVFCLKTKTARRGTDPHHDAGDRGRRSPQQGAADLRGNRGNRVPGNRRRDRACDAHRI